MKVHHQVSGDLSISLLKFQHRADQADEHISLYYCDFQLFFCSYLVMYSDNGFTQKYPSDETLDSDLGQERQRTRESLCS